MLRRACALSGLCLLAPFASEAQSLCAIQGAASASPFEGRRVTTLGVVTADFTANAPAGFFIQDPVCDDDAATSDAVFVSAPAARVSVGNRVSVTGVVRESYGQTTLELESLRDEGRFPGSLELLGLALPADADAARAYLEAREGMLVAIPDSLVVAATNHFGEAFLMPVSSGVTRLFRGDSDGRRLGLAAPAGWLGLTHGDRVASASGVLAFSYGEFMVWPPAGRSIGLVPSGTAPPRADLPGAKLCIGTYNLENLFDAADDPLTEDSVATPEGYAAALARRGFSIGTLLGTPDLIGVQEVESLEVLQALAVTPELAAAGYQSVLVEGLDRRGIDVGFLYKSERLRLLDARPRQGCTTLPSGLGPCEAGTGASLFSRPPLVASFERVGSGERLTAIVNHFKSQADGEDDEALRLAMADHVASLVVELQEAGNTVLVLGDLNDFEDSPTLSRLTADGRLLRVQASSDYSYVYKGRSTTLDYVLVDARLAERVESVGAAHVNVDFAAAAPGSNDGHRSSDHDPVLLHLRP